MGNILTGKTAQPLTDSASLSAGTVYEYACVASGSAETSRCRGALGMSPIIYGCVGDSVTLGAGGGVTGLAPPQRAAVMLAKSGWTAPRQVKAYNQGVIGAKSGDWTSSSSNFILARPIFLLGSVTHVFITLGINDASAVVAAATYGANLADGVNAWVAAGFKVILRYPTGIADAANSNRMLAYLPYIDALANGTTILGPVKETWSYFNEHPEELIDGIHQLDTGAESDAAIYAASVGRYIDGIPGQGSGGGSRPLRSTLIGRGAQ